VYVLNLENPVYVETILDGSLDHLVEKFSEASASAGSFSSWQASRHRRQAGELPRRLLRQDSFIDTLVAVCHDHCQTTHQKAA